MSRAQALANCAELGISAQLLRTRHLRFFAEAKRLAPVGLGTDGRDKMLAPKAAHAWLAMREAATLDGVELLLISGFRSFEFQAALIRAKLQRGIPLEEVLRVNAPPGFSEHHTGRAVDIGAAHCAALDEAFEQTTTYDWLSKHAEQFGFAMSYPRGNAAGFLYEPWHWCWQR